jgi:ketosteroid isomerase-like protein
VASISEQNAELVRESLRRMSEGGFAAVADLLDDDFTMDSPHGVEARQAHDKAGLEVWFAKMEEVWEGGLRFEPEETIALDDEQVLAAVRTGGRGRGTGIELDQMIYHLSRVRDGRIVRTTTHFTKEEALEAAGRIEPEEGSGS